MPARCFWPSLRRLRCQRPPPWSSTPSPTTPYGLVFRVSYVRGEPRHGGGGKGGGWPGRKVRPNGLHSGSRCEGCYAARGLLPTSGNGFGGLVPVRQRQPAAPPRSSSCIAAIATRFGRPAKSSTGASTPSADSNQSIRPGFTTRCAAARRGRGRPVSMALPASRPGAAILAFQSAVGLDQTVTQRTISWTCLRMRHRHSSHRRHRERPIPTPSMEAVDIFLPLRLQGRATLLRFTADLPGRGEPTQLVALATVLTSRQTAAPSPARSCQRHRRGRPHTWTTSCKRG